MAKDSKRKRHLRRLKRENTLLNRAAGFWQGRTQVLAGMVYDLQQKAAVAAEDGSGTTTELVNEAKANGIDIVYLDESDGPIGPAALDAAIQADWDNRLQAAFGGTDDTAADASATS